MLQFRKQYSVWKKLTKQIEPPIFVSFVVAETHDSFVNIENNDPGRERNTRRGSRKPQFLPEPQFARVFLFHCAARV